MKILSMTATFGKLDNETLEFTEGLNIITAPNEWGKSTWCAFLTAILYGIDTKARSTRDTLADKEKYAPWSGKPMEGSIRLLHQGRDITIQRRSKGRSPLGEFKAFETATGLPVRGLTKDNCSEVLVGVERSVFQRTGFIRLTDMPVSQDEALRRRLNSLVTTGDESGSADLLAKKLKELKNKCRYNRSGLIPEVQNEIRILESQLAEQDTLQRQLELTEERIGHLETRQEALELHRNVMSYYQAQEDRRRVQQTGEELETAQAAVTALEKKCENISARGQLLADLQETQQKLDLPDPTENAALPSRIPAVVFAALAAIALLAGILLRDHLAAIVGCGIALVSFSIGAVLNLRRYASQKGELAREKAEYAQTREAWKASMDLWQRQLALLEDLDRATRQADFLNCQLKTLTSMVRDAAKPERPDPLDLSREETAAQLRQVDELLQRCRIQHAQLSGRMESLSEREMLRSRLKTAKKRLEKLEETYRALDYAQKALEAAMQELQRRFAPQIARRAGDFLGRLTLGRYGQLSIDNELSIESAAQTETTLRNPLWRSDGTADQMYLALRLAVWEALTPEVPLVLDDALVRFDQNRLEAALQLLKELSGEHQILLFTCQNREEEWLS